MPKLYHSPHSRSSRVVSQLMLMGKLDAVEVICVDVIKGDGSGRKDPKNAHPEGKVPFLITDAGEEIRESGAIMMYLDELFGQPLSPKPGAAGRGSYLSWMSYYGGVLEPALVAKFSNLDHPALVSTFRTMEEVYAQLEAALTQTPFLLGEELSVADLIMASPFHWAPNFMPEVATIKDWVARVSEALDMKSLEDFEAQALQSLKVRETA
ncbi:glutathione S-transferase family protein [Pseudophaeobacter sp.]|uniref:glutathione S-transferase family protein n=1 Tax=Pseudophaeobacter sp. TaxID=1971739 RepID=UPI003296F222